VTLSFGLSRTVNVTVVTYRSRTSNGCRRKKKNGGLGGKPKKKWGQKNRSKNNPRKYFPAPRPDSKGPEVPPPPGGGGGRNHPPTLPPPPPGGVTDFQMKSDPNGRSQPQTMGGTHDRRNHGYTGRKENQHPRSSNHNRTWEKDENMTTGTLV